MTIEEDDLLLPTYARWPIAIVRGKGAHVEDDQGRRYLDLYGGHAVASTGHSHPRVVEAIVRAAGDLLFYSTVAYSPLRREAAAALVRHAPARLGRVFFCNSGTEANEAAMRIARKATGREGVVSFLGSFHGRTMDSASATGIASYREGARPGVPGHTILPWADEGVLERIDRTTALVLLEPIQSMAGVRVAPADWLAALRRRTSEVGALLAFDEVQTAFGRTGTFFSSGWAGVEPDLITMAKGIASGIPMGAVLAANDLARHVAIGDLGSTFGGGPVACAAAVATIRVIEEERLAENAAYLERVLRGGLGHFPEVVEVSGRGLLLGLRLATRPAKEMVVRFREAGVLLGTANDPAVLRLLPPLVLAERDLEPFWAACERVLR